MELTELSQAALAAALLRELAQVSVTSLPC
jgi:hypothetical protein